MGKKLMNTKQECETKQTERLAHCVLLAMSICSNVTYNILWSFLLESNSLITVVEVTRYIYYTRRRWTCIITRSKYYNSLQHSNLIWYGDTAER